MKKSCLLHLVVFISVGICLSFDNLSAQAENIESKTQQKDSFTDAELAFLPTHILAEKIRSGDVSSVKITKIYLSRIGKYNPKINAIATLDKEGAIKRATEADDALSKGINWGPLHGVPITIKDNYKVKGMRSTAGYQPLKDFIPNEDASIVKRLRAAGAIIMGKTNMPAMGMDSQSYNPIFGTTNNPWDITRTPGGSSGGCSAAVAAGLTSFSIGNDIGGSIRIPAHFTGVFGIKTTENFIPETGMVVEKEGTRTIRHLVAHGPIARSTKDLLLVLDVIAGTDGIDYQSPRVVTTPQEQKLLFELKVAWDTNLSGSYISPDTDKLIKDFIDKISEAGVQTRKSSPDNFDYDKAMEVFSNIFVSEVMADLSWLDRAAVCIASDWCPAKKTMEYFEHLASRDALTVDIEKFLTEYDVWILPVASDIAFKHRKADSFEGPMPIYNSPLKAEDDPTQEYKYFLNPFNVSGHPSVVIPIGFSEKGLPIGIQVIGKRWYDAELLVIAEQLAGVAGKYKHPLGYE